MNDEETVQLLERYFQDFQIEHLFINGRMEVFPRIKKEIDEALEVLIPSGIPYLINKKYIEQFLYVSMEDEELAFAYKTFRYKRMKVEFRQGLLWLFARTAAEYWRIDRQLWELGLEGDRRVVLVEDWETKKTVDSVEQGKEKETEKMQIGMVVSQQMMDLNNRLEADERVQQVTVLSAMEMEIFPKSKQFGNELWKESKGWQTQFAEVGVELNVKFNLTRVETLTNQQYYIILNNLQAFARKMKIRMEVESKTQIVMYVPSQKVGEVAKQEWRKYYYSYIEDEKGYRKPLQMVVKQLYPNGDYYTNEDWTAIVRKIHGEVNPQGIKMDFSKVGTIVLYPNNEQQRKACYKYYDYSWRKLEGQTEDGKGNRTRVVIEKVPLVVG